MVRPRVLGVPLLVLGLVTVPSSPAVAACSLGTYRAGVQSVTTSATGVQGEIQIPTASEVAGFSSTSGHQSVGDVFLDRSDQGNGFVQAGWYVGAAAQLPYTSTPKIFIGEYHAGATNDEVLRTYSTVAFGSAHSVRIEAYSYNYNTYYNVFVSGNLIDNTIYPHNNVDSAAFTGETDYNGVAMWAESEESSAPYETLRYLYAGTTWKYFSDSASYYSNYAQYDSYPLDGDATDLAWGSQGSC